MKRLRAITGVVGIMLLLLPAHSFSLPAMGGIMIVELQTGTTDSLSQEFVELYNDGVANVDVSKYKLEYYSATSGFVTPSRSIPLHGTLYSGKHYLVASTGYLVDKAYDSFSGGFAKTGGHVQLVSPDPSDATKLVVHDLLGWGSAIHPETEAASAPTENASLDRKKDETGRYLDTDNNLNDFAINPTPLPLADNVAPPGTPDAPSDTTNDASEDEELALPTSQLLPLQITELLPNPAPPASDSTDEYVEIYNPNAEAVDLDGYKLQTGNSYSYSYTFTSGTIGPESYNGFLVTETGTLLANISGKARLIDPNGQIISETESYEDAADGLAWALLSAGWLWTTTPTFGAVNILSVPAVKAAAVLTVKPKVTKASTTKPKAVKAASTKKTTTAKKSAASDQSTAPKVAVTTGEPAGLHPAVLAGVSALAVGYAGYEYRHDVANRIYQFRRYRASRRDARKSASGR